MTDNEIVDMFLARDDRAIESVSRKYGARLKSIAYAITRDRTFADECENDAYYEAWRLIPPNEPREYLFEFMAKIIRHKSIDRLRREGAGKRSAELVELTREMEQCIPAPGGVEREAEANELAERINAFLRGQPRVNTDIFLRRYWYFDSIEAIAKRFCRSKGSVKNVLWRMREKLKACLSDCESEDKNER